ncbi:uncharacterized protein LOC126822516 isoform X1 [Patella vulgata]|uniref:uncharacterized protein LOC126822516 isoform X1 n=1 Tax=Patella vulgata TaxID=6465 RepID=UPI002180131D|nr:uncharacterized protein LOC126822516 isoform X1 [Patella vulgata]
MFKMDMVFKVVIIIVVTVYSTDAACNGNTTQRKVGSDQTEYASSPGYLNSNYTNNLTCRWLFTPKCQNEGRLHVEFVDMDIQRPVDLNCVDYIDLYKGQTPTSGLKIARMCGKPGYEAYHGDIKGNLLIIFHSDATETGKGFYAKITCIKIEEFPVAAVAVPVTLVSLIVLFCVFKKKQAIAAKRLAEAEAAKKKAEEAKKKAEGAKKNANAASATKKTATGDKASTSAQATTDAKPATGDNEASKSSPTTDTPKKVQGGAISAESPTNIAPTTTDIVSATQVSAITPAVDPKPKEQIQNAMAIPEKKVPCDEILYGTLHWSPNVPLSTPAQNGTVNLTQVHVLPASNQMPVMMTNHISQTSNVANNHNDNEPLRFAPPSSMRSGMMTRQQIPIQHEFCSVDILPPPYSEI